MDQPTFDFAKQSVDQLERVFEEIDLDSLPANNTLTNSRSQLEIKELAQSIQDFGQFYPIILAEYSDGQRVLKDGTARVLACRMIEGRTKIQAEIFRKAELVDADMWTVIVNTRRSDNVMAQLERIQNYYDQGMSLNEIMRWTGLKKQELEKLLKLKDLNPELKKAIKDGRMTINTAHEVRKLGAGFQGALIEAAQHGKKITADMVHEARNINAQAVHQAIAPMLPMDLPAPVVTKPTELFAVLTDAQVFSDRNAAEQEVAMSNINGTPAKLYKLTAI